ncbi:MAG: hypothetical protein AAFV28_06370, partial [Cyanobacteria bacterium J06635_13]
PITSLNKSSSLYLLRLESLEHQQTSPQSSEITVKYLYIYLHSVIFYRAFGLKYEFRYWRDRH